MRIERIACGSVNCFIVEDGDDAILVDTGRLGYRDKVDKACEQVNLSLIVLTHGHIDHVQNAQYYQKNIMFQLQYINWIMHSQKTTF